jgi:hypothetical protein
MLGLEGGRRCAGQCRTILVEQSHSSEKHNRHYDHDDLAKRQSMGSDMLSILPFARAIRLSEAIVCAGVVRGGIREIAICHIFHSFSRMKLIPTQKSSMANRARQKASDRHTYLLQRMCVRGFVD